MAPEPGTSVPEQQPACQAEAVGDAPRGGRRGPTFLRYQNTWAPKPQKLGEEQQPEGRSDVELAIRAFQFADRINADILQHYRALEKGKALPAIGDGLLVASAGRGRKSQLDTPLSQKPRRSFKEDSTRDMKLAFVPPSATRGEAARSSQAAPGGLEPHPENAPARKPRRSLREDSTWDMKLAFVPTAAARQSQAEAAAARPGSDLEPPPAPKPRRSLREDSNWEMKLAFLASTAAQTEEEPLEPSKTPPLTDPPPVPKPRRSLKEDSTWDMKLAFLPTAAALRSEPAPALLPADEVTEEEPPPVPKPRRSLREESNWDMKLAYIPKSEPRVEEAPPLLSDPRPGTAPSSCSQWEPGSSVGKEDFKGQRPSASVPATRGRPGRSKKLGAVDSMPDLPQQQVSAASFQETGGSVGLVSASAGSTSSEWVTQFLSRDKPYGPELVLTSSAPVPSPMDPGTAAAPWYIVYSPGAARALRPGVFRPRRQQRPRSHGRGEFDPLPCLDYCATVEETVEAASDSESASEDSSSAEAEEDTTKPPTPEGKVSPPPAHPRANDTCPFSHQPLDGTVAVDLLCGHSFAFSELALARQRAEAVFAAGFSEKDALICPLCGAQAPVTVPDSSTVLTYSSNARAYTGDLRKDWQVPLKLP